MAKKIEIDPELSIRVGKGIELCLAKVGDAEALFGRNRAYLKKRLGWLDSCRQIQRSFSKRVVHLQRILSFVFPVLN